MFDVNQPHNTGLLNNREYKEANIAMCLLRDAYVRAGRVQLLIEDQSAVDQIAMVNARLLELGRTDCYAKLFAGNIFPASVRNGIALNTEPRSRPQIQSVPAALSFSSWERYLATISVGVQMQLATQESDFKALKCCLDALDRMHSQFHIEQQPHWLRLVMGNDLRGTDNVRDMFGSIDGSVEAVIAKVLPQEFISQRIARQAAHGVTLINGLAGTGKSHLIIAMSAAIIAMRYGLESDQTTDYSKAGKQPARTVVITGATNPTLEDIYERACDYMTGLIKSHTSPLIIRFLAEDVKGIREARGQMQPDLDAADTLPEEVRQPTGVLDLLQCVVDELLSISINGACRGLNDPRLGRLRGSLGFHMLVFAGLASGLESPHTNREKYTELRELLPQYVLDKASRTFTQTRHLIALAHDLRNDVLAQADLIVTRVDSLGRSMLRSLSPYVVMFDEAANVSEAASNLVFGNFPNCRHLVLAGDSQHLSPAFHSPPKETPNMFEEQMKMSLFIRLLQLGFPATQLNTTRRSNKDLISPIISPAIYNDKLKVINVPIDSTARQISTAFKAIYGHSQVTTLFKLQTVPVKVGAAWENEASAIAVISLLIKLVEHGISKASIVILTPYEAQCKVYRRLLAALPVKHAEKAWNEVRVRNIYEFQGREAPCVLLDFVVGEIIDKLSITSRILLAVTRASSAMYVFANARMILSRPQHKTTRFGRLLTQYEKKGLAIDVDAKVERSFVEQFQASGAVVEHSDEPKDIVYDHRHALAANDDVDGATDDEPMDLSE